VANEVTLPTLKERVEGYTGKQRGSAAMMAQWLAAGQRQIVQLLPPVRALDYVQPLGSLAGVNAAAYRVFFVKREGVRAREVSPLIGKELSNTKSIHRATAASPAWYREAGEVTVVPLGGSVTAYVLPLHRTVDGTLTTIASFPDRLTEGVVVYAGILQLTRAFGDNVATLSEITAEFPTPPTAPVVPVFTVDPATAEVIDEVAFATLENIPTFAAPTLDLTADLALIATYLNTQEDIELTQGQIEAAKTKLGEYTVRLEAATQATATANMRFQAEVQRLLAVAQAAQSVLVEQARLATSVSSQNAIEYLKRQTEEYGSTLARYAHQIQAYAAEVGARSQLLGSVVQARMGETVALAKLVTELRGVWVEFLKTELGLVINDAPKPT